MAVPSARQMIWPNEMPFDVNCAGRSRRSRGCGRLQVGCDLACQRFNESRAEHANDLAGIANCLKRDRQPWLPIAPSHSFLVAQPRYANEYTYAMYLATLGVFFALAVWLEIRFHVHLYGTRKERILITSIFFVIGVAWDSISTIEKTWIYPGNGLVGIWIGVLPIEEYLFSLVVPFWILTVYRVLEAKLSARAAARNPGVTEIK